LAKLGYLAATQRGAREPSASLRVAAKPPVLTSRRHRTGSPHSPRRMVGVLPDFLSPRPMQVTEAGGGG
jgi:hypothetical protein